MNSNSSLVNWIKEEFTDISFNDNRLTKRFAKVAQGLAEKSEKIYPVLLRHGRRLKGATDFLTMRKLLVQRFYNLIRFAHWNG